MTSDAADDYVSIALRHNRGGAKFSVTVGLTSVPAVVEAFDRRGYSVETSSRLGCLEVSKVGSALGEPPPRNPPEEEVMALALLRHMRSKGLSNVVSALLFEASEDEISLLRKGEHTLLGAGRTKAMCQLLPRA